jgi:hypothetical protein
VQRPRHLFLSALIALTAALAFAAPLFHAHLDAAHAVAQGLCGEHPPASGDGAGDGHPCTLCLAHAHASAALVRVVPICEPPARTARAAAEAPQAEHSVDPGHPGAPRAPPFSA